jgi:hypothetical protein
MTFKGLTMNFKFLSSLKAHHPLFTLIFLLCALSFFSLPTPLVFAGGGRYANISINGNHSRRNTDNYIQQKSTVNAELGIPLTSFIELSGGYIYSREVYDYTQFYIDNLQAQNYKIPNSPLFQTNIVEDYYVNLGIGYPIGFVTPTIFGGGMVRKVCTEDAYENTECVQHQMTWNAGASLMFAIGQRINFKVTYRVSPSAMDQNKKKYYDDTILLGLTFAI